MFHNRLFNQVEPTSTTPAVEAPPQPANPELPNALAREVGGDWNKVEKRIHDNNRYTKSLEERLQALEATRVDPSTVAAARPTNIESVARELAVDPEVLARAVMEVADYAAEQRFGKLEKAMQARASVASKFPDFPTIEGKVIAFLEESPDIKAMVADLHNSGRPEAALRLAVREFEAAQPKTVAPTPAERVAAALPPTNGAAAKPVGEPAADREQFFKEALDYAHRTHDPKPAFVALFGDPR